jgi:hypothetical protein
MTLRIFFNSIKMLRTKKNSKKKLVMTAPFLKKCSLASLIFLSGISSSFAQRKCGTMDYLQYQIERDSSIQGLLQKTATRLSEAPPLTSRTIGPDEVLLIPLVVHVVYHGPAENISEAQIRSQLTVLNEDYRRLNVDKKNTPAVFASVATDPHIQFRLAGITRTHTKKTSFSYNDDVKYTSKGGIDAWDAEKYLNIWVCNLGDNLLGYAQFPGLSPLTDGVVIKNTAFGNTGTAAAPYDKGRTATHEIGHWLNLFHIWGDRTDCKGTDHVDDTPLQGASNSGCPAFPHISCNNSPNGDMFMNYMDYTDDACMNLFTKSQQKRMQAVLSTIKPKIADAPGLGIAGLDNSGKLSTFASLAQHTKAGDWTYTANDKLVGTGDFNGDGHSDILLTSEWGIGIISNNGGNTWTSLMTKPLDTKFGIWMYTADNTILSIADFNGDGKQDILIQSENHLGVLTLKGKTFSVVAMATSNSLLGGWRYNDAKNDGMDSIRQVADFNGDKNADILLTSSQGLGILTIKGTKLTSLVAKKNGSTFGPWILNTDNTFYPGTGDFNKDQTTDLLMTSADGLGVFSLDGNNLKLIAKTEDNTSLGSWHYNTTDNDHKDIIQKTGDFNGDGQSDILLTSETGIGIISLKNGKFSSLFAAHNQTKFSGWVYDSDGSTVLSAADFNGDKQDDIVMQNDQGIGLFYLSGTSLKSMALQDYNTSMGNWYFSTSDEYSGSDLLSADAKGKSMLLKAAGLSSDKNGSSGNNTIVTGTKEPVPQTVPEVFRVAVFPNPASQSATLEYMLLQSQKVSFILYNSLGTKVFEYAPSQDQAPGHYVKTIDLSDLNPGIYVYTYKAGAKQYSSKLMVVEKP